MQQHYLPKGAYLRFFEVPKRTGCIYLYQRQKEIVLASLNNVAKEKHLYSFTDKDGKLNLDLEKNLGIVEQDAAPVLEKLGRISESLDINVDEFNILLTFISLQAVRTPAFRRFIEQIYAAMWKTSMQAYARQKDAFEDLMKKVRAQKNTEPFPNVSFP